MYPIDIPDSWKKNLFLKLVDETIKVNNTPRFYNTITSNCTNTLANMINEINPNTLPLHYARYLTGYTDDYLYKKGYIPNSMPFKQTQKKYFVSDFVKDNYDQDNFSEDLRIYLK